MNEKIPQPNTGFPYLNVGSEKIEQDQLRQYASEVFDWFQKNPEEANKNKAFIGALVEACQKDSLTKVEADDLLLIRNTKANKKRRVAAKRKDRLINNAQAAADQAEMTQKSQSDWDNEEDDAYEQGALIKAAIKANKITTDDESIEPVSHTKLDTRAAELETRVGAAKNLLNVLRRQTGMGLIEMQQRSKNFTGFYGKIRALSNRAEKLRAGEVVSEAEINQLRQEAHDFLVAFKAEVKSGNYGSTPDEPDSGNAIDGLQNQDAEWLKRNELRKAWKAKQAEYDELFQQKWHKFGGQFFGLNPQGFAETKQQLNQTKAAYAAALKPALKERAEKQNKSEVEKGIKAKIYDNELNKESLDRLQLVEQKYEPWFIQRYIIDDARRRQEAKGELLSPDKKRLVKEIGARLKKYKWPLRIGSVILVGTVAAGGAAVAGVGLASAAGVGALAGGARASKMAFGVGSALLSGAATYRALDVKLGVNDKKERLITTDERIRTIEYDKSLSEMDKLTDEYQTDYSALEKAQRRRNFGTGFAGAATGVLAGASTDQIVDTLGLAEMFDRAEFMLTDNNPMEMVNPPQVEVSEGLGDLPVFETNVQGGHDGFSDGEIGQPVSTIEEIEVGAETTISSEPPVNLPIVENSELPLDQQAPPFDRYATPGNLVEETTIPEVADEPRTIPEPRPDFSETQPVAPEVVSEPEVEAKTLEVGTDLETLEHTTVAGDWVSKKLIDFYPQYFDGLSRDQWESFIESVNKNPELLEQANITSGDLNKINPGDTIRYDLLAEHYINDITGEGVQTVSIDPTAVESAPATPGATDDTLAKTAKEELVQTPNYAGTELTAEETSRLQSWPKAESANLVAELSKRVQNGETISLSTILDREEIIGRFDNMTKVDSNEISAEQYFKAEIAWSEVGTVELNEFNPRIAKYAELMKALHESGLTTSVKESINEVIERGIGSGQVELTSTGIEIKKPGSLGSLGEVKMINLPAK